MKIETIGKFGASRGAKDNPRIFAENLYPGPMEGGELTKSVLSLIQTKKADNSSVIKIEVSAPGKVILHGDHSAVYGRLAIAASLGLRTNLTLTETVLPDGQCISLMLNDIDLKVCYPLKEFVSEVINGGVPLIEGNPLYHFHHPEFVDQKMLLDKIDKFLQTRLPHEPLKRIAVTTFLYLFVALLWPSGVVIRSIYVDVKTSLQVSAGMGSSASFAVTIVAAFIEYVKRKYRVDSKSISESYEILCINDKKEFSQEELALISLWAYHAEKITHGNPSGIDNATCTYGSFVQFRKGSEPLPLEISHKLTALLIDTKVPKNTRALVNRVSVLKERHPKIVEHTLDAMEIVSVKAIGCLETLSELSFRYKKSVSGRQEEFLTLYNMWGELVDMNQNLLRTLGVSHVTIDKICTILTEAGLHGKLTGAGGGGFVLSIIPFYTDTHVLDNVLKALTNENFDFQLLELGGDGVTVH